MAIGGITTEGLVRLIVKCVKKGTSAEAKPFYIRPVDGVKQRFVMPDDIAEDHDAIAKWIGEYEQGHQIRWLIYRTPIAVGCYTKVGPSHWSYHAEAPAPIDLQAV